MGVTVHSMYRFVAVQLFISIILFLLLLFGTVNPHNVHIWSFEGDKLNFCTLLTGIFWGVIGFAQAISMYTICESLEM